MVPVTVHYLPTLPSYSTTHSVAQIINSFNLEAMSKLQMVRFEIKAAVLA